MLDRIASTNGSSQQIKTSSTIESIIEPKGYTTSFAKQQELVKEIPLNSNEKEKVAKVVDGLNEFLSPSHTSLKFEFHEKLNEYYVTLIDDKTKEIVKEIPSKKMLDFYAAMTEAIGLMIDKKI